MNVYNDTCAGGKSQSGNLDENICPRGENIGHSDVWFWIDMVHKWMGWRIVLDQLPSLFFACHIRTDKTRKCKSASLTMGAGEGILKMVKITIANRKKEEIT